MKYLLWILFMQFVPSCAQTTTTHVKVDSPKNALFNQLLLAYPDFLQDASKDSLLWNDGTKMPLRVNLLEGSYQDDAYYEFALNNPDLRHQLAMKYPTDKIIIQNNYDPGRIRYEPFFEKMYGKTEYEVRKNLTTVYWLPSTLNKPILVTKVNGVDKQVQAISNELDRLPHLHKYVNNLAGTYNYRAISGTSRKSAHSWGIALDINTRFSNYWKWSKEKRNDPFIYVNIIPKELISIFEKYGFISGAKWGDHFDTMHFEFRPELLPNFKRVSNVKK